MMGSWSGVCVWVVLLCVWVVQSEKDRTASIGWTTHENTFEAFVEEFGLKYETEESLKTSRENFHINLQTIEETNTRDEITFRAAPNKYADISWEDFKKKLLMDAQNCTATGGVPQFDAPTPSSSPRFPPWFDWRDYSIMGPVKDQKQCGSCWAFSATGAIEAHEALKKIRLKSGSPPNVVPVSEQQLLDCSYDFGNNGCKGGLPSRAFDYLEWQKGIDAEATYPYQARSTNESACRYIQSRKVVEVPGGAMTLPYRNEEAILEALITIGPVSVAYEVTEDFRFYTGGVYRSSQCGQAPSLVNHAIVLVGYNTTEDGIPYWIAKNSWGANWGENGYFRIERGVNMCGIADCASLPVVTMDSPHDISGGPTPPDDSHKNIIYK